MEGGHACSLRSCPSGCHGHGLCQDGECRCFHNYTGVDCATPRQLSPPGGCELNCTRRCLSGCEALQPRVGAPRAHRCFLECTHACKRRRCDDTDAAPPPGSAMAGGGEIASDGKAAADGLDDEWSVMAAAAAERPRSELDQRMEHSAAVPPSAREGGERVEGAPSEPMASVAAAGARW